MNASGPAEKPRRPVPLLRMPNGDLYADPGGPVPDDVEGYARDPDRPHRLRPLRTSDFNERYLGCCRGL